MKGRLRVEGLSLAYESRVVLDGIDTCIPDGAFTAIIGANGCGKSSLLKSMVNLLRPTTGAVRLDGREVSTIRPRELAKEIAMLPQSPLAPEGITVAELVARGRFAWQSFFTRNNKRDDEVVANALAASQLEALAEAPVAELSGGQRQRAWIAMVLAQDTPIILLDEPTNFLDLAHQVELMELIARLRRHGKTIVAVLHDINQAGRYADHLIALAGGMIAASGAPSAVVTPRLVESVFNLKALVVPDPVVGTPMAIPT